MPFIGNAGQFSNIHEKNYTTSTLHVVEGDALYQAYNPADSHYKLITDLQEITTIGNVTANTISFTNPVTSIVTSSNIGVANSIPIHTMDIGANIYIDDLGSNTIYTSGTTYSSKYKGVTAEISDSITTQRVIIDQFYPRSHGYVRFPNSNVGIQNNAPIHTLDVGANVQIDEYGSNTFYTSGNVHATRFTGDEMTIAGAIVADSFVIAGQQGGANPTPALQSVSETLPQAGQIAFSSDRTLTLSNVTYGMNTTVINAITTNSNLVGDNVTVVTVTATTTTSNLVGDNVTVVTTTSNLVGDNVTVVTTNSNLVGDNVTVVTVTATTTTSNLVGDNVTVVTTNSNLVGDNVTVVTTNSNLVGDNVTVVTTNSNLIAGNVTVDNNLIVNTDDLVVDTVNSRVGINKASPTKALDVTGEIACTSHLTVGGNISGNGDAVFRKYTIASPGSGQYSVIGSGFDTATVNPTLTLMRGQKYVFNNTVHGSHPLEIRNGYEGSAYTSGVSGAGTATIIFTVPMNAPIKLYYQCTQHPAMGNIIYIPLDSLDTSIPVNLSNNLVVNTDDLVVDTVNSRVGIGLVNPAHKLDVVGSVQHGGLSMTAGTNIDQLTTITKTYSTTNVWMDAGITGTELATGSYIVQIESNEQGTNMNYNEYYTGLMSWYDGSTDSTESSEIILHAAGKKPYYNHIYLRVKRVGINSNPNTLKLEIRRDLNTGTTKSYVFRFRRMI